MGMLAQKGQRQPLREQRERQLVFLVTERRGDFLKERGVTTVAFGHLVQSRGFACKRNCAAASRTMQTRVLPANLLAALDIDRPGQRNIGRKFMRQVARSTRTCARCDWKLCG